MCIRDSTGEEYDYEISAEDGSILQVDKEMDKGSVSTTQNQDQNASENSTQQGSSNTANQTEAAISEEEATNLALERDVYKRQSVNSTAPHTVNSICANSIFRSCYVNLRKLGCFGR